MRAIAAISQKLVNKSLQRVRQRDFHGDGWHARNLAKLAKIANITHWREPLILSFNSSNFQISPDSEPDGVASQVTIQNIAETF